MAHARVLFVANNEHRLPDERVKWVADYDRQISDIMSFLRGKAV
jgi:hypothetical protein